MKKHTLITILALVATSATASISLKLSLKSSDAPQQTLITGESNAKKSTNSSPLGIVTPAFQNAIHNDDFLTSDSTPLYTIRGSGRYYLAGNIMLQRSSTTSGVGLAIEADNVTLNMNSKVIMPHVSSAHTTATAVQVGAGMSNIQLMNGTVQAVDSNGTQRFSKGVQVETTGTVNYTVKMRNLFVTRCKGTGIEVQGVNDLSLEHCTVNDTYIASGNVIGADLDTVNNLVIKHCEFNNNDADSGTCTGLRMDDCADGSVENCMASNNQASGNSAGVMLTYSSSGCKNISFKKVNASSNNSSGGTAHGFNVTDSATNYWEECDASNNNSSGGAAYGMQLTDSSANCNNSSIKNSRINRNYSTSAATYGLYVDSNNNTFDGLNINGNYSSADAAVAGIYLNSSSENKINSCHMHYNNNSNTSSSSSALAYGLYATASNNNHLLDCHAIGNTSTANNSAVKAVGFYSTAGSANRFEKCIANGNSASHASAAVTSSGFEFASTETRSQLIDCEAVGNVTPSSSGSARAYGIHFSDTTGAVKCIVKNCYMAYNSASSGRHFGFYDNDAASDTVLINNLAVGQGKSLGGNLDASLQWNNNSEPSSSQNYFWKHAGTTDDPRNVLQEAPILNYLSISTTVGDWTNLSIY